MPDGVSRDARAGHLPRADARASRVSSPRLPRHPRRAGRVALHPPRDAARIRAPPRRRSAIVPVGRPRDALVVPASRAVVNAAADDAPDAPVSPFPELEATKASDAERSAALCKDTTRAALAFAFVFATTAAILAAHFGAVPLADLPRPETWAVMHSTSEGFRGLLPTVGGVLRGLDYFGTALFAQAGVVQAGRRGMDLLGCLIVGCITAMGGGTFRGFALGEGPVFWAAEPDYLYISLAASLLTFYLWPAVERRVRNKRALETWLNWGDAISIGAFCVIGANNGLRGANGNPLVAVAAGMFTASFGGIVETSSAACPPGSCTRTGRCTPASRPWAPPPTSHSRRSRCPSRFACTCPSRSSSRSGISRGPEDGDFPPTASEDASG